MRRDQQAQLLRNEIEAILTSLGEVADLRRLATEPLHQGRRALADLPASERPWPLLTLMVTDAVCGDCERALPAAAAIELLKAAAEVFDDIEDADSNQSMSARYGCAVATNVATTLLVLAEKAIARLKARNVPDRTAVRVMECINSFYTDACAGQHLSLALASEPDVSEETYYRIANMKSGSQLECACHIGALLGNATPELINEFSAFGRNIGMASQIANDIVGVMQATDLTKNRLTLPIVYALTNSDEDTRAKLEAALFRRSESSLDLPQIRGLLLSSGAIFYAATKMEFFKKLAATNLSAANIAGFGTEQLTLFLE